MKDEKNLRVALKYWRTRRGMSIERLAKEAGVSTITIQRIEKENRMPRPDVLERLTKGLDVSMEELVVDSSEESPPSNRQIAIAV
jgi:transcriptional regulator with XRE-family HTH domain